MARVAPTIGPEARADHTGTVVTAAGVIAALYYGREILIPITLAVLLSFAIAPAVKLMHKLGLGRVLPVAVAVVFTFVLLAGLAALIVGQVRDLSGDLPKYEATVIGKIDTLKQMTNSGAIRKLESAVSQFSRALGHAQPVKPATNNGGAAPSGGAAPVGPAVVPPDADATEPMLVQVVQPSMGPFETVLLVSGPLLHPLSLTFVVLIFVVFILLQREDLRNRAIRLFGANDLQRTTAAINDGAKRLSRYLLAQSGLNACAGLVVGTVLWLIGVPSPILLGIIFALARFVPYIGAVMGAALPLMLATAVDPGWTMVLWTAVAIGAIELAVGQFIEPFAYGHNTGLSPIAIVLAAAFWTTLWGPVGLFLSTPLTVCLVVLGRHVERLSFLDVLLGDRPPLTPAETFYQRLLANDPVEAADQAQRCLQEMSVAHYLDEVALPGLLMAQGDATDGRLDTARQERIRDAALEVVEDLQSEVGDEASGRDKPHFFRFGRARSDHSKDVSLDDFLPEHVPERLRAPGSVLCIGARGPLDDAAAAMLAQVFNSHGIGGRAESFARLSKTDLPTLDLAGVSTIVVSALDGSSPAFLRFIMRRLRRHAPAVEIVVGTWWRRDGYRDTDEEIDEAIRQPKLATFLDAVRFCFAEDHDRLDEAAARPRLSVAS